MPTIKDLTILVKETLYGVVGEREADNFAWLLLDNLRGYSRASIVRHGNELLSDGETTFIMIALERLKSGEPIQYVLGHTEFMGLTFKVDSRVLIPRPETEELVEWILSDIENTRASVLDIGTGSGCIAIAIKNKLPGTGIEAWDISVDALDLARENALLNNTDIDFRNVDVMQIGIDYPLARDIVISNPPYVKDSEKSGMAANVLDHEPHQALFVADDQPLVFYNVIAKLSQRALKPGGKLYFEINQAHGNEVVNMLEGNHFYPVILKKDISGRDRMVRATWPGDR